MNARLLLALAALTVGLAACDRALLEEIPPDLAVVSPDIGEVQLSRDVTLRVSAEALSGVERVRIGGVDAAFDPTDDLWEADLFLSQGTNPILLEAFSADGSTTQDTAFVVFAPLTVASPAAAILPEPRAGLTATRLNGGGVLLAGGTSTSGNVVRTAHVLFENTFVFAVGEPITMQRPRTGHTATALFDGRVLLLGGTSTPTASPGAFVEEPEIIDPATQTSRRVIVRGAPIQRSGHVTTLLDLGERQFLYVSSGQAPGSGRLLTPGTVEIAEFREGTEADTLVTLTPSGGATGGAVLPDPTQVVVGTGIREVTAIISGLTSSASEARRVLYSSPGQLYPFAIDRVDLPSPVTPRTAADGSRLAGELALLAGGLGPSGETLASIEVYSDAARRWVAFPPSVALGTPRREHAVTLAPSGRILVIGGRGPNGQPLATLDVLSF
ncbi:MAG: kelch repeat-containing protein [Bacteroidota bacterium]